MVRGQGYLSMEQKRHDERNTLIIKEKSELQQVITGELFEKIYEAFITQADENAISGKAHGGQTPMFFSKKPKCDGAEVCTHYGQGSASKTPYLNWWVVSIYYLPEQGNIYVGIEEDRYAHLSEMQIKPREFLQIGNKNSKIATYYSTKKGNIDYSELYSNFIIVCEDVMRLGLH